MNGQRTGAGGAGVEEDITSCRKAGAAPFNGDAEVSTCRDLS